MSNKNNIPNYNKGNNRNNYLYKRDQENLARIQQAVNNSVRTRLDELRNDPNYNFSNLKHVQVNYFNILALKPKRIPEAPTALNWGDAVVIDPNTNIPYLCCIVYFSPDKLTAEIFQMLLGLTSKVHNWKYSERDDLYIDQLGVYIDKVDFNKEEGDTNDTGESKWTQ